MRQLPDTLRPPALLAALACAVLVAAAGLPVPARAQAQDASPPATPAVGVRVLPSTEVYGTEYTLGEVAELEGSDLALVRRLAAVPLGRAPLPGRSLRLSASFLRARLARAVEPKQVRLVVPDGARVVRASQTVPGAAIADRVLAAAAEEAQAAGGEVEQELGTTLDDVVLPRGEVSWQVQPLGRHLSAGGARTYRVVASVDGEEVWRTLARVEQQVFREVVVAARPIRRNQVIRPADVTLERKAVAGRSDEAYLTDTARAVGARAKRPIGRGEWLHAALVAAVADVPEGGPVTLVYATERLHFTAPGVAMVPGEVGAFIPVRNLDSGQIVYGVVQKNDTVQVN